MKFTKQQKTFSCGSTAIKNLLACYGRKYTEKYIREIAGTNRKNGTNIMQMITTLNHFGFKVKIFKSYSGKTFVKRLKSELKNGNKIITLTMHFEHWILVSDYYNKYFTVIDSMNESKLKKVFTEKDIMLYCLNFKSDSTLRPYYYGLLPNSNGA